MSTITVADYTPKQSRLDFLDDHGMACGGIMGPRAHVKAAELIQSGRAVVRICGIDSKMNSKEWRLERRARGCGKTKAQKQLIKSLNY